MKFDEMVAPMFSKLRRLALSRKKSKAPTESDGDTQHRVDTTEPLRQHLNRTLGAIKKTRLADHAPGEDAIYALPWYLVIGLPESDLTLSTDFIKHSGLEFSHPDIPGSYQHGYDQTDQPIWWFTPEAILINTPGTYVTDEEKHAEWKTLVAFFRTCRGQKPLDGLIVQMNVPPFLSLSETDVQQAAAQIRIRIDEITEAFKMRLPVYLVFSQCQHFEGFMPFFKDLSDPECRQVWGCTFSEQQQQDAGLESAVEEGLRHLYQRLLNRRMFRLPELPSGQERAAAFVLPQGWGAFKDRLASFVKTVFQPNPYKKTPFLRGVYLTGLDETGGDDGALKPLFTKELFDKVIFPDRHLIKGRVKERSSLYTPLNVSSIGLLVLLLFFLMASFWGNKGIRNDIRRDSKALQKTIKVPMENARLPQLYSFQKRIEQLEHYSRNGAPLRLRLGMYQGEKLLEPATSNYFTHFRVSLLNPVDQQIKKRLLELMYKAEQGESIVVQAYPLLFAHLTLTDASRKPDTAFLQPYMLELLTSEAYPRTQESEQQLASQLDFYLSRYGDPSLPYLTRDDDLIRRLRPYLGDMPSPDRIYLLVKEIGGKRYDAVNLATVLSGHRNASLTSEFEFPGIYTKAAWNEYIKAAIPQFIDVEAVLWPEKTLFQQSSKDRLEENVRDLYFADYAENWRYLLQSVRLKAFDDVDQAVLQLESLLAENSPLATLCRSFVSQTRAIDRNDKNISMLDTTLHGLHETLQVKDALPSNGPLAILATQIETLLKKLTEIKQNGDIGKTAMEMTRDQLSEKPDAFFANVWADSNASLMDLSERDRLCLTPLWQSPVQRAWELLLKLTEAHLQWLWKDRVCKPFAIELKQKFPFDDQGADATFREIGEIFEPTQGAFGVFYHDCLAPYVMWEEGELRSREWLEMGINLSPEFYHEVFAAKAISEAFYAAGESDINIPFEIYPIPIPQVDRILLQIENNRFDYRNQPQMWNPLTWPVSGRLTGTRLTVSGSGQNVSREWGGVFGFIKLLKEAEIKDLGNGLHLVSIPVPPYTVAYQVRTQGSGDIFDAISQMTDFECEQ